MSASERAKALRKEAEALEQQAREEEFAAKWKCYVCGVPDEEGGGDQGYLTEIKIEFAPGEEGDSRIESYLCDEHLTAFCEAMETVGLVVHAHGGICFLEPSKCPGANGGKCPTPQLQFEDH